MSQLVRSNLSDLAVLPTEVSPIAIYPVRAIAPISAPAPRRLAPPPSRDPYAKAGFMAALSVLALVLAAGVGILIGRGDRPAPKTAITPAPSPSPQVVVMPPPQGQGCQVLCFGGN